VKCNYSISYGMGNIVIVVDSRIPQELVTMVYLSVMLSLHHFPLSRCRFYPISLFIAINPTFLSLSLSHYLSIYACTLFKVFQQTNTKMEELTKLAKLFFILLAFTFAAQQIQGHTHYANAIFFFFFFVS